MKRAVWVLALVLVIGNVVSVAQDAWKTLNWDPKKSGSQDCSKVEEVPTEDLKINGWIHWVVTQADLVTAAELVLGGTGSGTYTPTKAPGGTLHFYTPYFNRSGLSAVLRYQGTLGQNPQFNISDYCPGQQGGAQEVEELTLSKTMATSYTRTHSWSVEKTGDPAVLYLYIPNQPGLPSEGTVNYTITVNYEGYEDSDFKISGKITIQNTGNLDAVITEITDVLAGMDISDLVDWGGVTFPYTLSVGATLTGTFELELSEKVEGYNIVTVTTERDEYVIEVPIVWGKPTKEINKTVCVKDTALGVEQEFTEPDGGTINVSQTFEWDDFKPGSVNTFTNVAELDGLGLSASFTVTIYVQGWVYETAYAKGAGAVCFIPTFSNWGWTNPVADNLGKPMDLWAAAGQCDTWRGIKVGTVTIDVNGGFSVKFDVGLPFKLAGSSVYAGPDKFPKVQQGKKVVETVAPGQYYLKLPYTWVIVHAQVGIPDPKFGP